MGQGANLGGIVGSANGTEIKDVRAIATIVSTSGEDYTTKETFFQG